MAREQQYGPAMAALNPQHRAWVLEMYAQGTMNMTEAARSVGYVDKENGAIRVTAHRIAHRPDVKAAMQEETRRRLTMALPMAEKALIAIVANDHHRDQIRAVEMIFNRAGVPPQAERNVNVNINVTLTDAEKIDRIRLLAEKNGIPLPQILGTVTDAEFSDVAEEPDAGEQDA